MLHKIISVYDLDAMKDSIPVEVYEEAHRIASILDHEYGPGRDQSIGGYLLIAENIQDMELIQHQYQDLIHGVPEHVNILKEAGYINALYIRNNDFGINVLFPEKFVFSFPVSL